MRRSPRSAAASAVAWSRCHDPRNFRPGDRVRVLHGPFIGLVGVYAGMKPRERVEVLLAILRGAQRVTLAADAVEQVP